jgi:hypothetical protein
LDLSFFGSGNAANTALTLFGVDTLLTNKGYVPGVKYGFDFVTQTACTSFSDYPGCHSHFFFSPFSSPERHFDIWMIGGGYAVKMGKVNLDSLKTAPTDLEFQKSPGRADSIPPDSLSSRVGNSYWIKTGVDPRDHMKYFAKIRILSMKVLDSANRKVEMVFLWGCNVNGGRTAITSDLDTFHFGTTAVIPGNSGKAIKAGAGSAGSRKVFMVAGERFVVPAGLDRDTKLWVYDLAGKKLGSIVAGRDGVVDLRGVRKGGRGVAAINYK